MSCRGTPGATIEVYRRVIDMRKTVAIIIAAVFLVLVSAGSVLAQYPPDVKGNTIRGEEQPTTVLPDEEGEETLPFTGADVTLFAIAGISAVTIGTLVVRRIPRS